MKHYIRDLDDGTVQRVQFADDPGVSIPQWRLDDDLNKALGIVVQVQTPAPTKRAAKKKAKK
jgi:hypothetical protein